MAESHAVVRLRTAVPADVPAIAALHADSWRRHYRGAYSDHFLDHEVDEDRLAEWTSRLAGGPSSGSATIVADRDRDVIGLAHVIFHEDPKWGALLDNLHVTYALKRSGLGTRLMAEAARRVLDDDATSGLYLWVLGQNAPGQAFYQARGGQFVERRPRTPKPGEAIRCVWPDPSVLLSSPTGPR